MSNKFDEAEWSTSVHGMHNGRWVYQDYDGEQLHVYADSDGTGLWVETFGEGPVWLKIEEQHLAADQFHRPILDDADLEALPVGSVVLVDDNGEENSWQKFDDVEVYDEFGDREKTGWACPAYTSDWRSEDLYDLGPVTLLHAPKE